MTDPTAKLEAFNAIRDALAGYIFTAKDEDDLQGQVFDVLLAAGLQCDREVRAERGRYDIEVKHLGTTIVLELKVSGSAAAVERQSQKYALTSGIDIVVVVTTSIRLGRRLLEAGGDTLGGKPFRVLVLRAF